MMTTPFNYHQMLPSREYGGAAEVAFRLLTDIQKRSDSQCTLWLPGKGRAWDKAKEQNISTKFYAQPDIVRDSRSLVALANFRTGWRLRSGRPGLLHLHSTELYGGLPWASACSGLRSVVHVHLEQDESTVRWAFRQHPDLVITCASFLVDNIRRYLPPQSQDQLRIEAVPNCIDTEMYQPGDRIAMKQKLGAKPHVPLVLMLANLAPHKGQETALRAIALLKEQGTEVQCWLAGIERDEQKTYETKLQQLAIDLKIDQCVTFLGFRDDAPELLHAADFFLLPSTREGLPLSVLEAQASGVPVLAAPTSGTPEVIQHQHTGFLIPADDAAGYAHQIAELISKPDQANRITERALQQVRSKHNVEAYCERIWELYQALQSRRLPKAPTKVVAG